MTTIPKVRDNVAYDVSVAMNKLLAGIDGKGATKNCMNCTYFISEGDKDLCQRFNARPPARIIVSSCADYEDVDSIPF